MTARSLLAVFNSIYVVALTAWVGSVLFFTFGVSPIASRAEAAEPGGRFVGMLLPRLYAWGAISGAIALPAFLGVPLSFPEYRGPMVAVQASVILAGILMMLYGGNTLVPALDAAQEAIPAARDRVIRLRRRTIWINYAVLAIGLGLLVGFANRPRPRTAGILEMTPMERARYDRSIEKVIEEMEERHGLRVPRSSPAPFASPGERVSPLIDDETIKELDEIFRPKAAARREGLMANPGSGTGIATKTVRAVASSP